MVTRRLILALVAGVLAAPAGAAPAAAASALRVEADSITVELGKPAYVTLYAAVPRPRLDGINLGALDADFIVQKLSSVEPEGAGQRWRLRLYPRRSGELAIAPLQLGGSRSTAVALRVTPAVDPRSGRAINMNVTIDPTPVWLQQPLRVVMDVETDNPYAALESAAATHDGIDIRPLPLTAAQAGDADASPVRRLRAGWRLVARSSGRQSIQLPAIEYRHDGVVTHRFFPPALEFDVRPLPAYVPVTMPVGGVAVSATPDSAWFIKDQLGFLSLRVHGNGNTDQHVAAILRQFASNDDITLYPPQEESAPAADTVAYRLPFTPRSMGFVPLPPLRLQYFDPDSGTLRTRSVALGSAITVSRWLVWLGALIAALLAGALMRRLLLLARHYWRRYRGYREALLRLKSARSTHDIRAVLDAISHAERWPANMTVSQWGRYWMQRYPILGATAQAAMALQDWCYSGRSGDLEALRAALTSSCYRCAPALRILIFR